MERKIANDLLSWKNDKKGKCLTVQGQRQVGKTYIIKQFANENYEHVVYIDFSKMQRMKEAFNGDLTVDTIIRNLSLMMENTEIVANSTLIFLDEIQDCPRARTSLKSFAEDGRYDVIASGSLMGVSNQITRRSNKESTDLPPLTPMGYEKVLTMRSMDFEEYLWAIGFPKNILEEIKLKISSRTPLEQVELDVMHKHFRDFMIVGGMPESVKRFIEEGKYSSSGDVLDIIIGDIVNDINRYNDPVNARKTCRCFESIPEQLSSNNKKFQYSLLDRGTGSRASSAKYFENLLWIEGAGYGNFCYAIESPELPFKRIDDSFKVYMSDTGILTRMMGNSAAMAIFHDDMRFNMGALMENAVAECITKCGYKPRFYRKSSGPNQMELDFVLDMKGESTVIEVKSGKTRSSPSISKVNKVFHVDRRIMFENGNIHTDDDGVEHYPLFVAAFIDLLENERDGPEF